MRKYFFIQFTDNLSDHFKRQLLKRKHEPVFKPLQF